MNVRAKPRNPRSRLFLFTIRHPIAAKYRCANYGLGNLWLLGGGAGPVAFANSTRTSMRSRIAKRTVSWPAIFPSHSPKNDELVPPPKIFLTPGGSILSRRREKQMTHQLPPGVPPQPLARFQRPAGVRKVSRGLRPLSLACHGCP